jgi:hypothetical protein
VGASFSRLLAEFLIHSKPFSVQERLYSLLSSMILFVIVNHARIHQQVRAQVIRVTITKRIHQQSKEAHTLRQIRQPHYLSTDKKTGSLDKGSHIIIRRTKKRAALFEACS